MAEDPGAMLARPTIPFQRAPVVTMIALARRNDLEVVSSRTDNSDLTSCARAA